MQIHITEYQQSKDTLFFDTRLMRYLKTPLIFRGVILITKLRYVATSKA
ncbi:MAG: hypothetical protein ACTH5N_00375 [Psychroflexus halocasei]